MYLVNQMSIHIHAILFDLDMAFSDSIFIFHSHLLIFHFRFQGGSGFGRTAPVGGGGSRAHGHRHSRCQASHIAGTRPPPPQPPFRQEIMPFVSSRLQRLHAHRDWPTDLAANFRKLACMWLACCEAKRGCVCSPTRQQHVVHWHCLCFLGLDDRKHPPFCLFVHIV